MSENVMETQYLIKRNQKNVRSLKIKSVTIVCTFIRNRSTQNNSFQLQGFGLAF